MADKPIKPQETRGFIGTQKLTPEENAAARERLGLEPPRPVNPSTRDAADS